MGPNKTNQETVSVNGTTRTAHFEFNDRGRGPKIDSTIETNSRLIPVAITSKGNDYYKAAVDESFANGAWSSNAEKGSSPNHDAVYVSMNGTPEEGGILAKALLATPGMSILVRGNKIERVGPDRTIQPVYATEVIDAKGRTVLPGLWDMHQHMSEDQGLLDIANGVTSARDLGNDVDTIVELKKKWGADEAIGPRLMLAALIDGTSPYTGPTKLIVDSEDDFCKVIDKVAPLGFEQTKIYSSIKPELVPFIAKTSHDRGMRVSGHIPSGMYADDAVRAGYDEIQHANFLFLNFFRDVKETRTPARFTSVAERAATLDLDSPEVRAFIQLLKEHKTVSDPTVSIFE